jgi:hypothetical protein
MHHPRLDDDRRDLSDRLARARRRREHTLPWSVEDEDARRDATHLQRELRDRSLDIEHELERWGA